MLKVSPVSVIPNECDNVSDLITRAAEVLAWGGADESMKISHYQTDLSFDWNKYSDENDFDDRLEFTVAMKSF